MQSCCANKGMALSEEYFSIQHRLAVNLIPLPEGSPLPDLDQLEAELPEPFRLSNSIAHLEAGSHRTLRSLSDELQPLVEIINQQSQKINVLLGFVLSLQDEACHRHHTERFGAGGLTLCSSLPLVPQQLVQLKIFLQEEAAAIFCYGRVTEVNPEGEQQRIQLAFAQIRDEDRELLIRASLHVQSKQLKLRAQQRANSL